MGVRVDAPVVGLWAPYSEPRICASGPRCGYYQSAPFHPAMGFSALVPITRRLDLRFDPIYQRIGISAVSYGWVYQSTVNSPLGEVVGKTSSSANRWQIPALVEAGLLSHLRFGVGAVVSLLTNTEGMAKVVNPFLGTSIYVDRYSFPVSRQAIAGAVAALEFPFRIGNVIFAPELRYKRWFAKHYGGNWMMDEFTSGVAIRFSH